MNAIWNGNSCSECQMNETSSSKLLIQNNNGYFHFHDLAQLNSVGSSNTSDWKVEIYEKHFHCNTFQGSKLQVVRRHSNTKYFHGISTSVKPVCFRVTSMLCLDTLREHPFNFKRGWGMVFVVVKIVVVFASLHSRKLFATSCRRHYFFSTKTILFIEE